MGRHLLNQSNEPEVTMPAVEIIKKIWAKYQLPGEPGVDDPCQSLFDAIVALDKDEDGGLTREELKEILDKNVAKKFARNFDRDGDGKCDLEELLPAYLHVKVFRHWCQLFKKTFDKDNDGVLSGKEELEQFLTVINVTGDDAIQFMKDYDTDGDGKLTMKEFNQYLLKDLTATLKEASK